MTRIAYCTSMSGQVRDMIAERGDLNVYRALAHAGRPFAGWMIAGRAALTSKVVPVRLRELVILRVGHLMKCPYEIAQHTPVAEDSGIGSRPLDALAADGRLADGGFTPTELTVLELTTELVTTATLTPARMDRARELLGDEQLLEVLMIISRWSGLALMINALDVDIDTGRHLSLPP
ncbi:carboxymuconolactone decarboxylase [Microtetraspora sp. NBRC 13810]|uniref:carboxymuconolactone decarboxylase family protein n=1 Tax=Microtetraspora sp. NBRC 13810 TaxID=3030990 RepID=UPI0024A5033F|nr:carboxymuconolactone decarboxylase family protein [Microtetraspora sp. NBRC 13810]GLW07976.1 carboxymuconolactone decarboxylase [Microtetraspora sp. NBRC 13810]